MDFFVSNSNGKKLAVSMHEPVGEDVHSLAVLLPGFLDSKDYDHLVRLGEDLAEVGYSAVRFDPTGVWKSEGKISEYCITQYLRDLKSIIAYMSKMDGHLQTILVGHSLGGMVALLFAAGEEEVDAVVGIMPPLWSIGTSSFQEYILTWNEKSGKESSRELSENLKEQRRFEVPYSYILDGRQYDVLASVSNIHMPLLLVVGEEDDKTPSGEVETIFKKANEPKKLVVVKGVDHDYRRKDADIKKVNRQVLRFLREYSLI